MAVETEDVKGLADAFVDTLEKLSPKEREQQPSAALGENYNNVLQLAKESMPGINARLWPKPVEVYESASGRHLTRGTYADLETFARQITHLLPGTM